METMASQCHEKKTNGNAFLSFTFLTFYVLMNKTKVVKKSLEIFGLDLDINIFYRLF